MLGEAFTGLLQKVLYHLKRVVKPRRVAIFHHKTQLNDALIASWSDSQPCQSLATTHLISELKFITNVNFSASPSWKHRHCKGWYLLA